MPNNHLPERDRRFAYISTGDITRWARSTTRPIIKDKITTPREKSNSVDDLASLLRFHEKPAEKPQVLVIKIKGDGKHKDREIEAINKELECLETGLSISDKLNRLFEATASLTRRKRRKTHATQRQ